MKTHKHLFKLLSIGLGFHIMNLKTAEYSQKFMAKYKRNSRTYYWDFGEINYKIQGSGKPLLLLHDTFSGSSKLEFEHLTSILSQKYKVYSLDLLGYGFSEKPNINYTPILYSKLVNNFIKDVIKTHNISIITSGESSNFALISSTMATNLINKIIMINPYDLDETSTCSSKFNISIAKFFRLPFIGTTFYNLLHNRFCIKKLFHRDAKLLNQSIKYFYNSSHLSPDSRFVFSSSLENINNLNLDNCIKNTPAKLYIISSQLRKSSFKHVEDEYLFLNKSIKTFLVKKCYDLPHVEKPYMTNKYIKSCLND